MTGPAVDWEEVFRRDRELSIASMTPPDWSPTNAIQQRGTQPAATTAHPAGASLMGQVTRGSPATSALEANPELVGRAHFWGIPPEVAASMPIDQLQGLIAQHEKNAQQAADEAGGWQQFATAVAAVPAMFGLGAAKSILEAPRNIPIVGEFFRRQESLNAAIAQASRLEEGVRASTRTDFQWVNSTLSTTGSLAALWYPGEAAWRAAAIAGKAPSIIGITSPIARLAAQGGAAGWLLEGGGEHAKTAVLGGAVLGGAIHPVQEVLSRNAPAIAAAMDRVSKYFDGPWSRFVKPAPAPEEVVNEAIAKAVGMQPAVQDMAAASKLDELQRMATDPAATPETRQQALEMWNYLQPNKGKVTLDPALPSEGMGLPPEVAAGVDDALRLPQEKIGMTVAEASQAADQMSKASLIIDSPALAEAAGQTVPNDGTVAKALSQSNPGGTNIVPAVANPAEFMQQVGMNPEGMQNVRFARRPGSTQLDALISDEPISDSALAEYERYGVFSGQTAQTAAGRQVVVQSIENGLATVAPVYGGTPHYVPVGDLLPSAASAISRPVPGLYEELGAYVQQRVAATADAMGGVLETQRLGQIRNENMPGYIEDFLDQMGVEAKGERARVRQYFNERIVDDYSRAIPEESAFQRQAEEGAAAIDMLTNETPTRRLDRIALTKGFMVVPDGATGSYKLIDQIATPVGSLRPPTTILFDTREAAEEWLKKVQRSLPDVTPPSDVPIEVARSLPTQSHLEPSLDNAVLHQSLEASADDVAEAVTGLDPQLGEHVKQVINEAKRTGNFAKVHQAWEYALSTFQPMRARWSTISQRLAEAGMGDLRPWDDWDALTTALTRKHNWEHPWMDRWTRITDHFNQADLRNGTVTQIYEIEDDALRLRKAQEAGFSERQIQALDEMHQFFRELFPSTGLDPAREIARYISHVRARQSMGASVANAFEGYSMNPAVEPFYEMVRSGNMQLRELDARNLGNIYVRSIGFQKFMRADWDAATRKWRDIAQIEELKPLANTFMNWANLMKTGYVPGNDKMLDAATSVMQLLMPGFTRAQTAKIFNQGLTTTHLALLGYRPDVMARDSIQLFLALPRAGKQLLSVMKDFASSPEARRAMYDRGIEAGTIILGKPRIAGSGVFEPQMIGVMPGAEATGMQEGMAGMQLVEQQGARGPLYRVLQATSDALHDFIPDGLRHLEGSKLHPLYFYTKQSEHMRMVVGEAGIQRAERAIAAYRVRMEQPLRPGESTDAFEKLLGDSMARTFDPPVQQKFKDLIASGNDKEAAYFMGRQLTDATMFRYGMVENPEFARSTSGRIGMQMGNFSTQFYQYAKESLRNGHWSDKAKFLAMMGGVSASLYAAEKSSGWAFSKWQFYNSLTFTGGPWLSNLMEAQQAASQVSQMMYNNPDQPGSDYTVNEALGSTRALGRGFAQMLNPVGGLLRTVEGIQMAADSPDPANAFGRLFITGQRGAGLDYMRQEQQVFGDPTYRPPVQMGPYQNPVSGSRTGQPLPQPPQFQMPQLPAQMPKPALGAQF